MNKKLHNKIFILSGIVMIVIFIIVWSIVMTRAAAEREQLERLNQNPAEVVVNDKIENITSDLVQAGDDSAAISELDALDQQLNSF